MFVAETLTNKSIKILGIVLENLKPLSDAPLSNVLDAPRIRVIVSNLLKPADKPCLFSKS